MGLPMTKIEGVPDRAQAIPGMAYFADTGPFGKKCGGCTHRGYMRQSSVERWNERLKQWVRRSYRVQKCAMFRKLTGRHGATIGIENPCCKYFEPKPKA